jgi:hypothetical protein
MGIHDADLGICEPSDWWPARQGGEERAPHIASAGATRPGGWPLKNSEMRQVAVAISQTGTDRSHPSSSPR